MGVPKPLTREDVSGETLEIFDNFKKNYGFVPNFYGVMARSPEVLKALPPFANAVMHCGKLESKYKELAFLKASQVNGCIY